MDYSDLERSLCVCAVCESLVPVEEITNGDCYACTMLAAGCIELDLEIEVTG